MNVLIIGLGSIARKHIQSLDSLNINAKFFALRSSPNSKPSSNFITDIYNFSEIPEDLDFIIISNPTCEHEKTIRQCLSLKKPLFIEKPVFDTLEYSEKILHQINELDIKTYVAFNMRFHPAIKFLKKEVSKNPPIEYNSYCGSYLPNWRPEQDYRISYSAQKKLGGGVHLDVIHELDFCRYILGEPASSHFFASKKSNLEIDSYDIAHYILEYNTLTAFVTLNYYRRDSKRAIECVWDDKTWKVDLIENQIVDQEDEIIFSEDFNISYTYLHQMSAFIESLKSDKPMDTDIFDGIKTLKLALNEI